MCYWNPYPTQWFSNVELYPSFQLFTILKITFICFLFCSGFTISIGFFMHLITKKIKILKSKRDGYLIVVLGWLFMTIFGSSPYLISGSIPSITNAFFETMSGFTTTGSTILNDIESLFPKSILFGAA